MVSKKKLQAIERELAGIIPDADGYTMAELHENLFEKIAKYRDNEKPAEKNDSLLYIAAKGRGDLLDEIIEENGRRSKASIKLKNLLREVGDNIG